MSILKTYKSAAAMTEQGAGAPRWAWIPVLMAGSLLYLLVERALISTGNINSVPSLLLGAFVVPEETAKLIVPARGLLSPLPDPCRRADPRRGQRDGLCRPRDDGYGLVAVLQTGGGLPSVDHLPSFRDLGSCRARGLDRRRIGGPLFRVAARAQRDPMPDVYVTG